jgi:hypothetical protein
MIPTVCPAYLPNVKYCAWIVQQQKIYFTGSTTYQKQTFRNRTEIYGANGKLKLTVPIRHTQGSAKPLDKEVSIAYDMDWQKQHWKSICAAYRSAPYFEFYEAGLEPYYQEQTASLFDFNLSLITQIMTLLEVSFYYEIVHWDPDQHERMDHLILAKSQEAENFETYTQVFGTKFGFIPNLSILDVLFNLGPNCASYLKRSA